MSIETVLPNNILLELRNKSIISNNEVAISVGDLYYAKDVLTNEKRVLESATINSINSDNSLSESTNSKTLLKG